MSLDPAGRRARSGDPAGRGTLAFVVAPRTLARWPDAGSLAPADVDGHAARFRSGHDVWVVQTYVLLRPALEAQGWRVMLGSTFPPGALAIAHWDSLNAFFSGAHRARVIGVRADRPPLHGCEMVVVQNGLEPDDAHRRFVPLWPQPGLLPRDAARGGRVETVAYFGRLEFLPEWVRTPALHERLALQQVALRLSERNWQDYRDVDLVLSVRADSDLMLDVKPATKLYNAWLAGVPALLGSEPAVRSLRQSPLDYVEVRGPDDVLAAIAALRADPAAYAARVAHGRRRAAAFSRDAIAARWLALIDEVARRPAPHRGLLSHTADMLAQKLGARRFRRLREAGRTRALQAGGALAPGQP